MTKTKTENHNKSITMEIKCYAEKHTALFTAICSAVTAIISVYLQFCCYLYKCGKLCVFDIGGCTLEWRNSANILNILFYMTVSAVILIMNYIGCRCYIKNDLLKYFCCTFFLSLIVLVFLFDTYKVGILDIIQDFKFVILYVIVALLLTICTNIYTIVYAVFPSSDDLFYRLKNKYNRICKKYDNKNSHIKVCIIPIKVKQMLRIWRKIESKQNEYRNNQEECPDNNQVNGINSQADSHKKDQIITTDLNEIQKHLNEYEEKYIPKKINHNLKKMSNCISNLKVVILMLPIIAVFFFVFGFYQEKSVKEIAIIEDSTYFSENGIDCAIIYQNDKYILVSPCYTENNELIINTSYQYCTEIIDVKKHTIYFDKMTIKNQDNLDDYLCKKQSN